MTIVIKGLSPIGMCMLAKKIDFELDSNRFHFHTDHCQLC